MYTPSVGQQVHFTVTNHWLQMYAYLCTTAVYNQWCYALTKDRGYM